MGRNPIYASISEADARGGFGRLALEVETSPSSNTTNGLRRCCEGQIDSLVAAIRAVEPVVLIVAA